MKPKTIREVLTQMWQDARDEDDAEETIHQALIDIQQLIEECVPEKKPPCGTGTISDDNQEWWCDLDKGFNQAVDQMEQSIRELMG